MLPKNFIENWGTRVRWKKLAMVEQDLIISRALICLYNHPKFNLIFRGGTALNKLYFQEGQRYSEDIDLVQLNPEPIGDSIDAIREALDSWLGNPQRKSTRRSVKLVYKYENIEGDPGKLKIEINTTEHFQVLPIREIDYQLTSEWFEGNCKILAYELEELMATKLRALYQRRKGRDLFDLWLVFNKNNLKAERVISIFLRYCHNDGILIRTSGLIRAFCSGFVC